MRVKHIKINKPCTEKWSEMTPNSSGNYCDICSKTVFDFTKLSPQELAKRLKKSKGNVCARVTEEQLLTPIFEIKQKKKYQYGYSKVASGLMIASSLLSAQSEAAEAKTQNKIEINKTSNTVGNTETVNIDKLKNNLKPISDVITSTLKGRIIEFKSESPIANAKISFITLEKIYTTYSDKEGKYELTVPDEKIDSDNVIRVVYGGSKVKSGKLSMFRSRNYILTKEEWDDDYTIKAYPRQTTLGGIGYYELNIEPVVVINGVEVAYTEYKKAVRGKKSSCNLENKHSYHFESSYAVAIYGEKARNGLYLYFDKK